MSTSMSQFNHLRIPLDEIQKATNIFSENNIIGKSDFGYIYEGQLLHSGEIINVSARRLDRSQGLGDIEFLTEISVLSGLKHPNLVSLIGFCDENGEKIIIHRYDAKRSLGMYLDDPALTWKHRLRISIGIARAISYIHYEEGRNYSIIHRNINSSTILLDEKFKAKLSGFEFSIKDSADRMERYISSEVIRIEGYMEPETIKSGDVTQKSDIYSLGVVLLEILCGRKAFLPYENEDNKFLAPLFNFHAENNTLQDIILPDIWNQVPRSSLQRFANIARVCITERRVRADLHWVLCNMQIVFKREIFPLGAFIEELWDGIWQGFRDLLDMDLDPNGFRDVLLQRLQDNLDLTSESGSEGQLGAMDESTSFEDGEDFKNEYMRAWDNKLDSDSDSDSEGELGAMAENTSSEEGKVNKLEHLRIRLIDIQLATNNFSKESELSSDNLYRVYKGDLECFDREYVSSLEDNNNELPKRRYNNVRIKRFYNPMAKAMFQTEILVLSTCKHNNIVSLLGFCDEGHHMILVYEGNNINKTLQECLNKFMWKTRVTLCYYIARGLNYIHNEMEDQQVVLHCQISGNTILMDDKHWIKISGFGLSTLLSSNEDEDTGHLRHKFPDPGNDCYMAPEFLETGKATKESDIYSFGLVMFEILCGMDYPPLRADDNEFQAEHWFQDGIIKQKVAGIIREENSDNKLFLKKGPNEDSLDTFIKITEQCLAVNPMQRPTLQFIIKELVKALEFQKNHKDHLRMSFKDIESATQNFSRANYIGSGGFGPVYKGKLASEHGSSTIVAKRLDTRSDQGDQQFYNELHILSEYKHENVIGLVGYNNDEQERIIVYEYASKGSLDRYLNDANLTWLNRLNICIDVVRGLAFLHGGVREHEAVIHRDMKTANILLFDDWKAKVADFGLSLICTISDETDYVIDYANGTTGYLDPVYKKSRFLTKESDIYSLGVVLFEILYGKSTYEINKCENQFLHNLVKRRLEEGRLDEVVFNAIKNQIVPEALATFQAIAYQCLHDEREKRPTAQHVLVQLEKALELQVKDVPISKES